MHLRARLRVRAPQDLPLRGQRRFFTGFPIIPWAREGLGAPPYVRCQPSEGAGGKKGGGLETEHLPAAEKVKVQVIDRLAPFFPTIHDQPVATFRNAKLPGQLLGR